MKFKIRIFLATVVCFSLFGVFAKAESRVTEKQMIEFLKENAVEKPSCFYTPFHFINLKSPIFMIRSVKTLTNQDGKISFDAELLQSKELEILQQTLADLPMFRVTEFSQAMVWIEPAVEATPAEIIRGLYNLKKVIDTQFSQVYIVSQRICPGGISVNNF